MGKQDDKKDKQQRNSGSLLQVPNATQISDNGEIPLVFVNDGAEDEGGKGDKPVDRKRSRATSTVSMDSSTGVDQVQGTGTVRWFIYLFFLAPFKNNGRNENSCHTIRCAIENRLKIKLSLLVV